MIRKQIHYFQDDMPENIGYGGGDHPEGVHFFVCC